MFNDDNITDKLTSAWEELKSKSNGFVCSECKKGFLEIPSFDYKGTKLCTKCHVEILIGEI